MTDKSRKDFEAHFVTTRHPYALQLAVNGVYVDSCANAAWADWQAGRKQGIKTERERVCAAIKAEDDHCAEGDYMLDSDDCIKVVRGTWQLPKSGVAAQMGRAKS